MQLGNISFHGSYRYADRAALERALARARAELLEEELDDHGLWLRCFVTSGTTLTVNVSIPAVAEQRFAAANMFLILADGAVEGAVEGLRGTRSLDLFEAGAED